MCTSRLLEHRGVAPLTAMGPLSRNGKCFPRFIAASRFKRRADGGFTLLELVIVIAITIVLFAIALPSMMGILASARVRNTMSELSGLVQLCRSEAIRNNRPISLHFQTVGSEAFAYAKDASITSPTMTSNDPMTARDPQLPLGYKVVQVTSPSGTGAPTALTGSTLWNNSIITPSTTDISFNARGLPCSYTTGVACSTGVGFLYYFTYQPPFGQNRWTAISISPAGRVKTWFWDGSAWGN